MFRTFLRVLVLTFLVGAYSAHAATVALVGGRLIDGFGGPPLANSVILIEGDRIKAIGQVGKLQVPAGAEVISTEGMDVLPGLWDAHVHTMLLGHSNYEHWDKTYPSRFGSEIMPAAAKQLLMAGITSARDLGAPLKESVELRDRINRGEIPGPTLYVSGPFIQHEPYPGTEAFRWGVKGPEDARAKVKKLADGGVNIIKLIDQDQMTIEEVKAVVDEAHKRKLPVVAHAHRPEEIRRGLAAGADCFEHTGLATAPGYPDDVLKLIAERTAKMSLGPLFWCPTIEGFRIWLFVRCSQMKRLTTLLMAMAVAALTANAAAATSLGKQLAELESHIKWTAVEDAWKMMRTSWVSATAACDEAACVAAQLLKLEGNVKWAAVDADWKKRRDGWVSDCKSATSEAAVAKLLLEFEGNVRWRAVDEKWKARRESWIAETKGE